LEGAKRRFASIGANLEVHRKHLNHEQLITTMILGVATINYDSYNLPRMS